MTTGSGTQTSGEAWKLTGEDAAPSSWKELRQDGDIQFEPVTIPEEAPREPSWLDNLFEALAEFFEPVGVLLAQSWPVLKWILLALLVAAVLFTIYRIVQSQLGGARDGFSRADELPEWEPGQQAALALLEDADRLAQEGRFDEATHLLLQRSVGQIAAARPDWVEPSSTARELARLALLGPAARSAFAVIAERVERSLFALRRLEREDWEVARAAYAEFALAKIDGAAR